MGRTTSSTQGTPTQKQLAKAYVDQWEANMILLAQKGSADQEKTT